MVLFCACSYYDLVPESRKAAALTRLRAEYGEVTVVADLCGLAARRDHLLGEAAAAKELCVAACYPRAVRALFEWAGFALDPARVRFVNLREIPFEDTASIQIGDEAVTAALPRVNRTPEWIPWFPVIHRERCRSCRQCLEFCLFGVYTQDANGDVVVTHPEGCKTNCPACARLCPEAAIMFPKYGEPPINGAEVADEEAARARAKTVAEGDLRAALEQRRAKRRALLKPEYRPDGGEPQS